MNDIDDFERELARSLNRSVDERLGPRRPAPPFPQASGRPASVQRAKRWLLPLAAAACVIAVVGGTVGVTQLRSVHRGTPGNSRPTSTSPAPGSTVVRLGDATLRLPSGWVAREVADPRQYGSSVYSREWCLAPAESAAQPHADCPLQFGSAAVASSSGIPVNLNVPLGTRLGGNQSPCPVSGFLGQSGWTLGRFGSRHVYDRQWHGHCADGSPLWIEQYVVNTAPAYLLFSDQMNPELHAAMTEITQNASLPAQAGSLLLYDTGTVRSVTRQPNGYLMTIAPIDRIENEWRPSDEDPRSYPIGPNALKYAAVGTNVGVSTDGTKVISIGAPISAQ
jgi:hypothetical protein